MQIKKWLKVGLKMDLWNEHGLTENEIERLPPLTLAYIGDAVFEVLVRTYLVSKGTNKVGRLHKMSVDFVSARSQAKFVKCVENILTQRENYILKSGRNANSATIPKNANVSDYRWATGFEAVFGYLYLKKEYDRINTLIEKIIEYRQER